MPFLIRGRVQTGTSDASHWLTMFNEAYARKLGTPVFPGSLNLHLDAPFDWFDQRWEPAIVQFAAEEYGGERDILLLPCRLRVAQGLPAFLWSTTNAARDPGNRLLLEILAPVALRLTYGLRDSDVVEIELDLAAESVPATG